MRLPDATSTIWLDGRKVRSGDGMIPVGDPGLQAGLGVFETLAVRDRRVVDLGAHLARMGAGATVLDIELPSRDRLTTVVDEAARSTSSAHAWIKILALRSGRWIVLTGSMDPDDEERPVSAILLPWRRDPRDPLTGVKSTCYAKNQLGLELARRRGASEGLWLNSRGHLAEGCTSNVFVVRQRKVFTPALSEGVLPGVVRSVAVRAAKDLGFPIHETRIRLKRLWRADEAFLTSSLTGVRPLLRLDDRPLGRGAPGPITRDIASRVRSLRQLGSGGARLSETR